MKRSKSVSSMSTEEMQATDEYKAGVQAFNNEKSDKESYYTHRQRNLLFKIGWGDSAIASKEPKTPSNNGVPIGFLDKRTRDRRKPRNRLQ